MAHDWQASAERLAATLAGEKPDRVPVMFIASEDIAARISGLPVRELLANPERLARVSMEVHEVLGGDAVYPVLAPFCGPYEGLAFARANGKEEHFVWKDYSTPFLREGKVCATEADIDALEIPDHRTVEPWPTILEASALIAERTGIPASFVPSLTWSGVQMLRGSQAYIDVIENPELLLKLCEKIYASQMDYYASYCSVVGPPPFALNAQYAFNSHMLSFDDAWKFEGQFVARFCKETGLPLAIHNCGFHPYWEQLIVRLQAEGVFVVAVNGSHPLDLDEWVRFRKRFPDIMIMGASIFVNAEMENGEPCGVKERVKDNIDKLAGYGRFALSPVCCLPWRVSLSNILAVVEAAEEYGRY